MAWTLGEGIVDTLVDYISENNEAKLAALEAEYDDGIALPPFVAVHKAEVVVRAIADFPVCVILCDSFEAESIGPSVHHATYTIHAGPIILDADPANLRVKLYRYTRAIYEMLDDLYDPATRPYHFPSRASAGDGDLRVDYSAVYTRESGEFLADSMIVGEVEVRETR